MDNQDLLNGTLTTFCRLMTLPSTLLSKVQMALSYHLNRLCSNLNYHHTAPPHLNDSTIVIPFMKPVQGMWYFIEIFKGETKAMSMSTPELGSLSEILDHT